MAIAIPIMMVAGAAISAYGAMQQAKAQSEASQYNAALGERNAVLARSQADADTAVFRQHAELRQGSIIAAYGASGVTGDGSPAEILAMSAANAKRDEHMIRYKADLTAMGYRENAVLDRMQGRQAIEGGNYAAASSLLTGAGNAMSGYTAATRGYGTPISPGVQGPGAIR
jgi:hypothetical protein